MRIIHLFSCLSAFCLASSLFCQPAAIAQAPAGDAGDRGSTLELRSSQDSELADVDPEPVADSMPEDAPAESPPPGAGNAPPERKAAVIEGVIVFLPKAIEEIKLDIRPDDPRKTPFDFATPAFATTDRDPSRNDTWIPRQFMWQAPEFWHRPLYFDDVPLERYGQMHHPLVQPVLSGAHFFGTLPLLPYKIGIDRPCDEIATLGYYRPGSAAPAVGRRLPLETDAAAIETATWIGLILLLP